MNGRSGVGVCTCMCIGGGELRAGTRLLFPLGVHATVFRQVFSQFECTSIKGCTGWVFTGEHIICAQISKHLYTCLRHEGEEVCGNVNKQFMLSCSQVCSLLGSCVNEIQGTENIVAYRPVAG